MSDQFSYLAEGFLSTWNQVQKEVHDIAVEKGWYQDDNGKAKERNLGEAIALMHSELSEALESLRAANKMSDKLPSYLGVEEELADVIIRIMDVAQAQGYRVSSAVVEKIKYNRTRPYKHGKKF